MSTTRTQEAGLVTITINEQEIQVPKGELVVEAVKRLGLEVPIFCYHPRMDPVGMCRMCLVSAGFKQKDGTVRLLPKPQTACTLPAMEGLVVYTDTEQIQKDRRGVLEFLLANHPLDCPICDRGGECPLQNNTLFYGPATSRFVEQKRHLPKAYPLSRYVELDLERCIQCGRCVRFTEEISGDAQLAFLFRGAMMQPLTFEATEFTSRFSGNTIEICPVGALTSREFRFRARPWDLETKPAICLECGNGCNTWFDYRVGKLVRINGRTHEGVNEEWTCDKGKFGHGYLNSPHRLKVPLVREGDQLVPASWAQAYTQILPHFVEGGAKVAGLVGHKLSNEALFLFRHLFREHFRSPNVDHRFYRRLFKAEEAITARHNIAEVHTPIAEIENAGTLFLFGGNLAEEQPIVYLRARKAWRRKGAVVVVASSSPTEADSFARVVLRFRPGSERYLLGYLAREIGSKKGISAELSEALKGFTLEVTSEATGIAGDRLQEAVRVLENGFTLLASRSLYHLPDGVETVSALANLSVVAQSTSGFNLLALGGNEQGCLELGLFPEAGGKNTEEILQACVDGEIRALWLVACDPVEFWHDRALAERALESVEFLVVQDFLATEALPYASVVLPCSAFPEQEGTYTNVERRVQYVSQILPPPGEAKPSWRIFSELELRLTRKTPPFRAREVLARLAEIYPAFEGVSGTCWEKEGALLGMPQFSGAPKVVTDCYPEVGR